MNNLVGLMRETASCLSVIFVQTDSSLDPVSFKEAGSFNARSGHGLVIPPACGVCTVASITLPKSYLYLPNSWPDKGFCIQIKSCYCGKLLNFLNLGCE